MSPRLICGALFLAACGGADADMVDTVLLEEACGTEDYGYDSPSADAIEALERANCYRNLMALSQGMLDPSLDQAAQAHADYMAVNGVLTHQESASGEGYTGEWHWDRATAAGYGCSGCAIMEVVAHNLGPAAAVDTWVNSVYHRVPFTMPVWDDAGFGLSGAYSSMTMVAPYPASEERAVIYPVHGQLDVPTTFDSDSESPDPVPSKALVGVPITVTVASATANSSSNPYSISLLSSSLTGPDGDVDTITLEPASDSSLVFMVAMVPSAPLAPDATYEAELEISWAGGSQQLLSVFTTAAQ